MSQVSSIGADINYIDTQYDDVFTGILADFTDAKLRLNYRRVFSDVTTLGASLSTRRYDSQNLDAPVDGYAAVASLRHQLSEKTRIDATIGFEDTDDPDLESDPELIGSFRVTRNLETIRFFAEYRRAVYGSGAGIVSVRDSVNLNFRRRLNERITAGLGVRAYQTDRIGGTETDFERNYVQLQSSVSWYLAQSLVFEVDYRYTALDRGQALGGLANSNRVMLWLIYQPRTVPGI